MDEDFVELQMITSNAGTDNFDGKFHIFMHERIFLIQNIIVSFRNDNKMFGSYFFHQ